MKTCQCIITALIKYNAQITSQTFYPMVTQTNHSVVTSLRATYGRASLVSSSMWYLAKLISQFYGLSGSKCWRKPTTCTYLVIVVIQSLKEGSKIWWASHLGRLLTNTLLTSITEKILYNCARVSGALPTRKSASQQKKFSINTVYLIQFVALQWWNWPTLFCI